MKDLVNIALAARTSNLRTFEETFDATVDPLLADVRRQRKILATANLR